MAPEILQGEPYGKEVDWWTLGILVFQMLTGKPPWKSRNANLTYRQATRALSPPTSLTSPSSKPFQHPAPYAAALCHCLSLNGAKHLVYGFDMLDVSRNGAGVDGRSSTRR